MPMSDPGRATLRPMILAAILAVILLGVIVVFQLALAFGAPWGAAAWGGQHPGVLPTRLRIASAVVAVVVYPIVIALVLAAAGIIDDAWLPVDGTLAMWVLAGLLGSAPSRISCRARGRSGCGDRSR